jgi:hypothetical protein
MQHGRVFFTRRSSSCRSKAMRVAPCILRLMVTTLPVALPHPCSHNQRTPLYTHAYTHAHATQRMRAQAAHIAPCILRLPVTTLPVAPPPPHPPTTCDDAPAACPPPFAPPPSVLLLLVFSSDIYISVICEIVFRVFRPHQQQPQPHPQRPTLTPPATHA